MKKLFVLLFLLCLTFSLFADAGAVRQTFLDVQKTVLAGDIPGVVKYYHKSYTATDANGKKSSIKNLRRMANSYKRFQKAIKPDSELMDIVTLYSYVRGKRVSAEDKKTVLAIQDSEVGKTRADALRKELKQIWDTQFRKLSEAWRSAQVVSAVVNGSKGKIVFTMKSVSPGTPEEVTWELLKEKKSWRIVKSTAKKFDPGK